MDAFGMGVEGFVLVFVWMLYRSVRVLRAKIERLEMAVEELSMGLSSEDMFDE